MTMGRFEQSFAFAVAVYGVALSLIWLYDGTIDGKEVSYGHAAVQFGRCPTPYFMEGRACFLTLVTPRNTLIEHVLIATVISLILLYFAARRLATGVVLVSIVGTWNAGWFRDGVPYLALAISVIVIIDQRIRHLRRT